MRHEVACALALILFLAAGAEAQDVKRGGFKESFTEKHPLSSVGEWCKRYGDSIESIRKADDKGGEYDLARESFDVYVPGGYDGSLPFGLVVFISPNPAAADPEKSEIPILDKHGLLWVGAINSGNERRKWHRANLALDAAHNMTKRYRIDPDRVYVGGWSGGARMACEVAIGYADVFTGGFFMGDCNYFRGTQVVGENRFWKPDFSPPPAAMLEKARTRGRYAIFVGEKCGNRSFCLSIFENGFKKDNFAYVQYFEQKDWGDRPPNTEWFEKLIQALDAPLTAEAPMVYAQAQKHEKAGKTKAALEAYIRAASHGRSQPFHADAKARMIELRPRLEAEAKEAFGRLKAAPPPAPKLREFARDWSGTEAGRSAREEANTLGEGELEKTGAKTGTALRTELQKFLTAWEGYPVATSALKTLDAEAQKDYDKAATIDSERARHLKLLAFAKTWAPSTVATRARDVVDVEAGQQLEDIKKLPTDREKIARLQPFLQVYAETTTGAQAKALLDKLKQK